MNEAVLILGASSGIGRAVAERWARGGYNLVLAGRDQDDLNRTAADLRTRYGVQAVPELYDALPIDPRAAIFHKSTSHFSGGLSGIIHCSGTMSEQSAAEQDFELARQMIDVNFTSAVAVLNAAGKYFAERKTGFICSISSVAGDRGRQSNFIYGASKAALSTYLAGLRNRLSPCGVSVITVKPGFVDTGMTYGLPGMFLVASPTKVADDIWRAVQRRRDTIYTPWFWRWIMLIIRSIPERIFKRMKM